MRVPLLDHGMLAALPPRQSPPQITYKASSTVCASSPLKDPLTGLGNRRHFIAVLERTIDNVARSGDPALLLMLDIDHFKKINDTHGHQTGDRVLQSDRPCHCTLRSADGHRGPLRWREFAVVLPNCHSLYGTTVAERIRATIEALSITVAPNLALQVTVSVGGALRPVGALHRLPSGPKRADIQLYKAKAEGRNRVFLDQQQEIYVSAERKISCLDTWPWVTQPGLKASQGNCPARPQPPRCKRVN